MEEKSLISSKASAGEENFNGESKCDQNMESIHKEPEVFSFYENVKVPTVILTDIDEYEGKPWKDPLAKPSDYFNYGFNENSWSSHQKTIKGKLQKLLINIKEKRINLNQDNDIMKYLFDLPSDYGGLGEILDDLNYENLNLYEHKYNKNKNIPPIEIINGQCFVPLESKRETLNNINGNNNVNNFHPLNNINHVPGIPPYPMNPLYYQMWMRTNYPMPEIEQSMIATKETESISSKRNRSKRSHRSRSSSSSSSEESDRRRSRRKRDREKKRSRERKREKERSRSRRKERRRRRSRSKSKSRSYRRRRR